VWRIRDVYPGSDFFPSRIQTVSIPDPGSESKNLSILTPKKWFLSSRKYDPGCSSRIPDPDADFYPSRIPDPGVKKAPDPGSGSATLLLPLKKIQMVFFIVLLQRQNFSAILAEKFFRRVGNTDLEFLYISTFLTFACYRLLRYLPAICSL
jgi:hypothetical protein